MKGRRAKRAEENQDITGIGNTPPLRFQGFKIFGPSDDLGGEGYFRDGWGIPESQKRLVLVWGY